MWFSKQPSQDLVSMERIVKEQKRLAEQLDWVEDEVRRIAMQHQTLSGRFYRRFGTGEGSAPAANTEHMSRDELRRMAGIRAGQPAPHK